MYVGNFTVDVKTEHIITCFTKGHLSSYHTTPSNTKYLIITFSRKSKQYSLLLHPHTHLVTPLSITLLSLDHPSIRWFSFDYFVYTHNYFTLSTHILPSSHTPRHPSITPPSPHYHPFIILLSVYHHSIPLSPFDKVVFL